jgi:hypothetical protein
LRISALKKAGGHISANTIFSDLGTKFVTRSSQPETISLEFNPKGHYYCL